MIHIMLIPGPVPLLADPGVPMDPTSPGIDYSGLAVEYHPELVDSVIAALDREMAYEPVRSNLALTCGFAAYMSILAFAGAGSHSHARNCKIILPWSEGAFYGVPLYFDPDLGPRSVSIVSSGRRVTEAILKAARKQAERV